MFFCVYSSMWSRNSNISESYPSCYIIVLDNFDCFKPSFDVSYCISLSSSSISFYNLTMRLSILGFYYFTVILPRFGFSSTLSTSTCSSIYSYATVGFGYPLFKLFICLIWLYSICSYFFCNFTFFLYYFLFIALNSGLIGLNSLLCSYPVPAVGSYAFGFYNPYFYLFYAIIN